MIFLEVMCGSYWRTITFNARLFRLVNLEFCAPFCFQEGTFPSFLKGVITIGILDLESSILIAILNTGAPARFVLVSMSICTSGSVYVMTLYSEQNFLIHISHRQMLV